MEAQGEYKTCQSNTGNAKFKGDHFISLTGLSASFTSLSERIWVSQADSGVSPNKWGVGAVNSPCVTFSYFQEVNIRTGRPIKFVGPNADHADIASFVGEYDFTVSGGRSEDHALAPPDHLCYFTYIAGNLRSTADSVQIGGVPPTGAQHVFITASPNASIRVKLRCLPFDQG